MPHLPLGLPTAAAEPRLTDVQIISSYVIEHAVQVCGMRCLTCQQALLWLVSHAVIPADIVRAIEAERVLTAAGAGL